ncbi:MAG: pirin family protein [Gammaproteobacteria bacterium]|nr:MAG: pirin family protein [Gammaproteobacteria bacterium]
MTITTAQTTILRPVVEVITSERTLEGGGFPVRRPFPTTRLPQVDPFLLLDHLGPVTWGPGEGIGAPDHPHRGFETVTYLLSGGFQHKDSAGHAGKLAPGDVQWMTAGSGVVHSELPSDEFMRNGGVMHGFQVWVNLPARDKMIAPHYQEIPTAGIPEARSIDGSVKVRVIAGEALGKRAVIETRTPIYYLHFTLEPGGTIHQPVPAGFNALVYLISGTVQTGKERTPVHEGQMARLGDGDVVALAAEAAAPADLLLLAGQPLNEPVARYGPFVMNTREEIEQAFRDYQSGRMGSIHA